MLQLPGKLLSQFEIMLRILLTHVKLPQMILHNIGIEDIRSDEERIMRLQPFINIRPFIFNQLSGCEHAAGLSSD